MATALNDIEGADRLSEYDGAGGIDAKSASYVAANNPYYGKWGGMSYSCSSPNKYINMNLKEGKLTRVVIAWDTNTAYSNYASEPSADIDLWIYDPNGNVVTYSASYDNTYEIVQFRPSVTGTYKIYIRKLTCDMTPKYLAWAYYSR
jgi:hypothetical protein